MPDHDQCHAIKIPKILYGTAWKEERTRALTELALRAGFRGVDTANQRKHYHEAAVGEAVAAVVDGGLVTRDELFLQTKFTFRRGQDQRLPYDADAPLATQVEQSFVRSLGHLRTRRLDSYLLHGPSRGDGLGDADWEVWQAMEALHDAGGVRFLGISNVTLNHLEELLPAVRVRPRFVQNRCYARECWDREVREFCNAHGIVYQGFSLLTANPMIVRDPRVGAIAKNHGMTPEQLVLCFAVDLGMLPLTGTTNPVHMRQDLDILNEQLTPEERRLITFLGPMLER